ncbi:tyrosine--tRNA ligase [Actinomycetospora termitidis]|uniref:Tyrosine--tRNA ligase n=1 Tax=Actinomycetospora termitidis TaxID=3053470 RepID=A0ABT7MC24_9PSEU|nr:tyrosine--tRNA ligase [Actinomycetospora sp. Odt1-22]MDL5156958.1 tyrosine--tRNA ligase [Actinomycetospora sp. Odt1-22]
MTAPHILDDLAWRGLIAQSTDLDALRRDLDAGTVTLYSGIDPTAPSAHIGHLLQWLTLARFQQAGHRPIALVGGATGLIGDPKPTAERTLNDREVVAGWVEKIGQQLRPFLEFTGDNAALLVNNLDWTEGVSALDFLRDLGKHFRVGRMLAKEAVSRRMESDEGISYAEFSYQILQSYDFLELFRRYGCTMQTGGSDQWGNLTAGIDLIHRVEGRSVHALGTPLITKADGSKFGKTEGGTVWLDASLTSPYAFYQFWINAEDAKVGEYLRAFTWLPREEIEDLERQTVEKPQVRAAQRALAESVTTLVHGAAELGRVQAASQALFGRGELRALDAPTLAAALAEVPSTTLPRTDNPTIVDLLVGTGLATGRGAARRTVAEGGAYVNNAKVDAEDWTPGEADLLHGRWLVVRRGKRTTAGVELVST